jgi:rhodanese-related sulfurtransferase
MVTEIDRDELKQKLDHPKKFVLVDALPSDDFHELHLPGAINIPADQIRGQASELLPKEAEIIVYCSGPACHASDGAARELTEMGYSNVRRYSGGKQDWIEAGLPVVRNNEPRVAA